MSDSSILDPIVYQALHTGAFGDRQFYLSLIKKHISQEGQPPRVLELGCGSGRILIELATAGALVTGIDLNESSLELCRQQIALISESNPSLVNRFNLICADFSMLSELYASSPQDRYDLVLITYNSLYCLPSERAQIKLIKEATSLLKPTGTLWMDGYALPDPDIYDYDSDPDFSPLTVLSLPAREDGSPRELGVEEKDLFILKDQCLTVSYRYCAPPHESHLEPLHQHVEEIKHRYIYPWQLPRLCMLAGVHINSLVADFGGKEINLSSRIKDYEWGIEVEHWVVSLKPISSSS